MFNRYFLQELSYLKNLAVEFSRVHPALAPRLGDQSPDPDVERLLEGVAFSTGLLRQKLEDEFPEIVHGLMDLIFPHYLRPAPSTSIITFIPKPGLKEPITVPKGTRVASIPVEGTPCIFKTCFDVEAHPLRLTDVRLLEQPGRFTQIVLSLQLTGTNLGLWEPKSLRFFLGGDYAEASNLYLLLNRHVKEIVIKPKEGGEALTLSPHFLRPCGFSKEEELIPYPAQSFPGYRIIQEYFLLPQKFLFMELSGLERWSDRGEGTEFDILFELNNLPFAPPQMKKEHFVLFASPVINIFDHGADPLILDHRQSEYPVRPAGANSNHYEVYSVDSVIGLVRGSVERKEYSSFELFRSPEKGRPIYHVVRKPSALDQSARVFLSLPYSRESSSVVEETLSMTLSCTNAALPEKLQLGDISQPTSTSPELAAFKNIIPVTASVQPPLGSNALWRFLSHLSLNYLSLAEAQNLKEILRLYIFPEGRDKPKIAANEKRVDGIEDIRVNPADRLVSGHMMRGQNIQLKLRQDHFASTGDMFLFGSILDHFLGVFASMNCFTQLKALDIIKGETYIWPPRIGETPLL
jgi:type VI secretion system protein ImpG